MSPDDSGYFGGDWPSQEAGIALVSSVSFHLFPPIGKGQKSYLMYTLRLEVSPVNTWCLLIGLGGSWGTLG